MLISIERLYSIIACGLSDWGRELRYEKKEFSQDSCVTNEFGSYIEINMYKVAVISLMQCKKVVWKCSLFPV
jgi:hypothetical protein